MDGWVSFRRYGVCLLLWTGACGEQMPAMSAGQATQAGATASSAPVAPSSSVKPAAAQAGAMSAKPATMSPPSAAQAGSGGSVAGRAAAGQTAPTQTAGAMAQATAGASGGAAQGSAGASGAPDTAAAGTGAMTTAPTPPKEFLPPASGPCPELQNGYVMFAPDGMQRRVLLYMSDAAKTMDGPLIFSWHSTLPNPEDATSWLGRSVIEEIKAQGGIVAAPATGYPNERRPWDNTPLGAQGVDGDQRLMDEVVACAHEKVGIDLRRIHATGMSAGGLKSADVSLRRSGYLASVVVYSGGLVEGDMPPDQDPNNKLAAMILYGGASDISPVDGINYTEASNRYMDLLKSKGRLAFLCNHGGGHSVPGDSQASAWRFMQDHPYGVTPDPYAMTLPDGFLRYCEL